MSNSDFRSFTIETIKKIQGGTLKYDGGRFLSKTPAGAARKAFSKAYHSINATGPLSLNIHIRETTRGSANKIYKYKVTRKSEVNTVERNNEIITYNFITKVKSIN
jgi:hypothetical protein